MSQYHLFQDTRKCIGCRACEIKCKDNKKLPLGPKPSQIVQVGPKFIGGLPKITFIFMSCYHCETPWCVSSCPTGAMQKRAGDGIVFVDKDLCVGCRSCISACPWGAPQWNPDTGQVEKCDFCKDRVDAGLKPACVSTCTTGCLAFGKAWDTTVVLRERHAAAVTSFENGSFQ